MSNKTSDILRDLAKLGYSKKKAKSGSKMFNSNDRYCLENVSEQTFDFYSKNGVHVGSLSYACIRELAQ